MTDAAIRPTVAADIDAFVARAQAIVDVYMASNFPTLRRPVLVAMTGERYVRIASEERNEAGELRTRSAWAFIDMSNGDVLKAASWKKPAKGARGNLFDICEGMGRIGPYGPASNSRRRQ